MIQSLNALKVSILFIALIILSGCQPSYQTHLRVAANNWIGYTPLYLADDMGLFEPKKIKMIEMPSASEVIHAFRSGSIEVAALTLDEALTIVEDNYDVRLILVLDISDGSDVLLAKPEIKNIAELKGKKVAVEYNAVGALLLDSALASADLTPQDVDIQSCNFDAHIDCYAKYDALVTFDPVKTKLLNQEAKLLYSSKSMPNVILDVLVTTQEVIDHQPEQLQTLLASYFQARTYLQKNPDKAITQLEASMKIPKDVLVKAYGGVILPDYSHNRQLISGSSPKLNQTLLGLKKIMLERKLLRRNIDTREFIDASFLERVGEDY
ncbi:ABC transporter substrate-binding protein [Pseudoalteromonas xiamenensis]